MVQKSGSPVEVGSLSHDFQGFTHPRWCRISSTVGNPQNHQHVQVPKMEVQNTYVSSMDTAVWIRPM